MKKTHLTLVTSLGILLLTSCSNDDLQENFDVTQKQQVKQIKEISEKVANNNNQVDLNITLPNGRFFATAPAPNGKAYFVFEGKPRHIQSAQTLNGLFVNTNIPTDTDSYLFYSAYISNLSSFPFPIPGNQTLGIPLTADNGLVHHIPSGKIYFREGNTIRYIPSIEIFNTYRFNMGALTNTNNINMYTIGSNVR